MGVIKQGILGGFSGKVGGVVGTSWKGIAVMKSLPQSVSNPQTAGQTTQRNAFTEVVRAGSQVLTEIVKPLWDRFAQRESGYNHFVHINISNWTGSVLSTPLLVLASSGSLESTPIDTLTATAASDNIQVDWTDNSGTGNALATDEVYIMVWNQDQNIWEGFQTAAVRSDATVTVTTAMDLIAAENVYAYLAYARPDGTIVSTSTSDTTAVA